jgi:hypothetical protein
MTAPVEPSADDVASPDPSGEQQPEQLFPDL